MANCLFCSIAAGEKETSLLYEDSHVVAFHDIRPKAPVHILIVPKQHIGSTAEISEADERIAGHIIRVASSLAEKLGIAEDGYFNTREHGGQEIDHLHLHLVGGRRLGSMV